MALDLPALERPAKAISGALGRGSSRRIVDREREGGRRRDSGPLPGCWRRGVATVKSLPVSASRFLPAFLHVLHARFPNAILPRLCAHGASLRRRSPWRRDHAHAAKPDLERGKQIATTGVRRVPHGPNGVEHRARQPAPRGPGRRTTSRQLAGVQVRHARPSPIMQGMAAGLTPEDMLAVGAYYSTQKPAQTAARDKAARRARPEGVARGREVDPRCLPARVATGPRAAGCRRSIRRSGRPASELLLRLAEGVLHGETLRMRSWAASPRG